MHVIQAAAAILEDELVVIGSQAVLGTFPDAPAALLTSVEVDLYPRNDPSRADEIDGALGDGSRFHQTYDYYAHGVGPETPIAPAGWEGRLMRVEFPAIGRANAKAVAWCIEARDLVLAKLAAGRPHDLDFAEEAIRSGLVRTEQLQLGVTLMPETHLGRTRERLAGLIAAPSWIVRQGA